MTGTEAYERLDEVGEEEEVVAEYVGEVAAPLFHQLSNKESTSIVKPGNVATATERSLS